MLRKGLLAKIHICRAQAGMEEEDYRALLRERYRVPTAAALTIPQMEDLVEHFVARGCEVFRRFGGRGRTKRQPEALHRRVVEIADRISLSQKRLRGLLRKVCGVEELAWCRDVGRLERLLKILGEIEKREPL
jgi:hypothetical protein